MKLLKLQYTECYCTVDTGPRGVQKLSLQNYNQSPLPIHTRAVETGARRQGKLSKSIQLLSKWPNRDCACAWFSQSAVHE